MLTLSATQADINTDNITEGSTNLFTTAARTRSHFTYGTGITHNSGTLSVTQLILTPTMLQKDPQTYLQLLLALEDTSLLAEI
ncbi:MAG: hypothetical protein CM15mV6_2360 [uncultured marine virus]|nr:MAG: hypothetical protein CM15mV6_2360 [uncultured marine virus]